MDGAVDTTKAGIYEVTYSYDGVDAKAKATITVSEVKGNTPEVDTTLPTAPGTNMPKVDLITEGSGSTNEGSKSKAPSNSADNRGGNGGRTNSKGHFLPTLNATQSALSLVSLLLLLIGGSVALGMRTWIRKKHRN